MYNNFQGNRGEDRKEDKPPYSRLFVVCSKQTQEQELRAPFERYGVIEDLYMPKDRNTGEPRGVAYIKFNKTSSAAAAINDLQAKPLKINNKPIKVMVALSKHDLNTHTSEERYRRLFIKVHKDVTETEIYDHFSKFGDVDSVFLQKDKVTDKCKGFAYVYFTCFLDAAKAFEECDRIYKPVFATPKDELKRTRSSLEPTLGSYGDNYFSGSNQFIKDNYLTEQKRECSSLLPNSTPQNKSTVVVTCSPQVPQKYIEKLFNIVPGMVQCHYTLDNFNGFCKALITYDNKQGAANALEKINNFEFPSGEIISVKPDENPINKAANNLTNIVNSFKNSLDAGNPDLIQLADAIAQASTLIKAATTGKIEIKPQLLETNDTYCSVTLPPPQPMACSSSRVAQRCFIVCKPYPPAGSVLRDAFCRFGDLIDVCTFPNKTFGFVKYASIRAAQEAIKTLNGAMLCGIHLKVLEADEKPSKDDEHKTIEDSSEHYSEHASNSKKMKLND